VSTGSRIRTRRFDAAARSPPQATTPEDHRTLGDLARDATHYALHSREAAEALRDLAAFHEARADTGAPSKKGCCAKDKAEAPPAVPKHDHE
jgi:hypothetical protein